VLIAVLQSKFIVLFIIIFGTLSFHYFFKKNGAGIWHSISSDTETKL